jgi:pimeloyl-ACP methyl ester carboxylesterase/CRP-like cAMP-binding protein
MGTYTIDGVRIYAREEGPRQAQLALLIHGWSSSWYALSPLLPLVSRRFRCLAIDLPGYGNSERLPRRTTIPRYVEILSQLIQELTDSPVVLIGHSMGGMISMSLALQHPHLVERMVLLCPTVSGNLSVWINTLISPITMIEQVPAFNKALSALEPSLLRVTDRLMRPASFAARTEISEAEYHRLRADARRPGQGRVRAECFTAMRHNNLSGRLRDLETPALVIWGAEDNTVPLRDAGVIADEWHTADLRIVPKAGHWPQFETPDFTLRTIASYLGLPVITSNLEDSVNPSELVSRAAEFLANSEIGAGLSYSQRVRLAAQCRTRVYRAGDLIAEANEATNEVLIVQEGSVEVWLPNNLEEPQSRRMIATLLTGQLSGEMSLIDGGRRSAELRAGTDGARTLTLRRDRLRSLVEDDPTLGNAVIWNIAAALALRLRLANWQQQMLIDMYQQATATEQTSEE